MVLALYISVKIRGLSALSGLSTSSLPRELKKVLQVPGKPLNHISAFLMVTAVWRDGGRCTYSKKCAREEEENKSL